PGKLAQHVTQPCGEMLDALLDRREAERLRVARGLGHAEHDRPCGLERLESFRVRGEPVPLLRRPFGAPHVDRERREAALERAIRNIEKAGAARAAEKFSRSSGTKVDADRLCAYRH